MTRHISLPLPTLLSQVVVAFTIEFDNESERQLPHWTTNHGRTANAFPAPWLVSLAMWENCMRFVGEQGVTIRGLEDLARTATNLNGMERWGYVVVEPDRTDPRAKPPRRDWVIRATAAGRKAQDIWRPLFRTIEKRWEERFGEDAVRQLRESLWAVAGRFDSWLPDCLPILGYGLFSRGPNPAQAAPAGDKQDAGSRLPLSALLSRVLLAFAIEFERESEVSLAISANVLRPLNEQGVRIRDIPRLAGVSKELIKNSVGWLEKRGYLVVETDASAKATKLVRLTSKGRKAQDAYSERLGVIEGRWLERFGTDAIRSLREVLEPLVGNPMAQFSPLFLGLEPHPDGWRASVPRPETLPHYPLVTHRGGFPDGS